MFNSTAKTKIKRIDKYAYKFVISMFTSVFCSVGDIRIILIFALNLMISTSIILGEKIHFCSFTSFVDFLYSQSLRFINGYVLASTLVIFFFNISSHKDNQW